MKLLFVSLIYPNPHEPVKGTFNFNLVRALARDHDVHVLSPIPWVKVWRRVLRPRCPDRSIDGVTVYHPTYYYPPTIWKHRRVWFYWKSVERTLKRILAENRPDAVIGYWADPDGAVAVRAARLAGARSAVIVGGSDVLVITEHDVRRRRVGAVLAAADSVLVVSDHLRGKVHDLGAAPANVHLWRQGVDSEHFYPGDRATARRLLGLPSSEPMLLWVGRMIPLKGLDVLLTSCSRLHRDGVPVRLYLVGDGPVQPSLEAMTRQLGLQDRVTFVGPCLQHRLGDWYRAADLTVLPSRSEGLPNVLRESIACGTPFVASRVGGIPEIAEDGIDSLVAPDDEVALADAIVRTLRRPRQERTYSPDSWARSAERLVELIQGPSASRPHQTANILEGAIP